MGFSDNVEHEIVVYLTVDVDGTEHGRDGYEKGPHHFEDVSVGGEKLVKAITPS